MPFRSSFDCLWCGQSWEARSRGDLAGWTSLCPDCLARADDNGFLRSRLRAGLQQRAAAAVATAPPADSSQLDDWYLRRGRFSRGPLHDGPWQMELDEVTRWLDAAPLSSTIVELGAGSGWWSPLLAEKGELWLYDTDGAALDAARQRLLAHRLLAHLHQRDPLAAADKIVDAVFAAHLLGAADTIERLHQQLAAVAAWLRPGGSFVFVEARQDSPGGSIDGPRGRLWPRDVATLRAAVEAAGLELIELTETRSAFVMGRARRPT